jgi:hypothetical protein
VHVLVDGIVEEGFWLSALRGVELVQGSLRLERARADYGSKRGSARGMRSNAPRAGDYAVV